MVCEFRPIYVVSVTHFVVYICLFRNNFLKIDIYYGQLKSEEVEEKEAYDVVSFFSK